MVTTNQSLAACIVIVFLIVGVLGSGDIFNSIEGQHFRFANSKDMVALQKIEVVNYFRANITTYFRDINRSLTYEDIFEWENYYLRYNETRKIIYDPIEIFERGIGKCGEFSTIFAAGCISVGLEVKKVGVVTSDYREGIHSFNEIKKDGFWVQADTSINSATFFVNDTSIYHNWHWWSGLGTDFLVFTFDDKGQSNEVTNLYLNM